MKKKKSLYPCEDLVEQEKNKLFKMQKNEKVYFCQSQNYIIPNYEAFPNWDCEKVLAFLNID